MAESLGEKVGETVGYRMRGESRVGPHTRLEVVTQGVLTRMLQEDPLLEGVAGILFDEFHERSLEADLGLALALDAQSVRDDLRLLVMSATDRKSTRLNSSHVRISYAVFCLKKKKKNMTTTRYA